MRRFAFAFIIAAVLLILVAILLLNSLFIVQRIAVIETVRGIVEVRAKGSDAWKPVAADDRVRAGDTVRTGPKSSAIVGWVDGTRVKLAEETVLTVKKCALDKLDKTQTSLFKLDIGKVWVRLMSVLSRGSKFNVETPAATAGVRGTIFSVSVEPDWTTSVSVYRGSVAVATGDASTVIPSGSAITIKPDKGARDVRTLSEAEDEAWLKQESILLPRLEVSASVVGDVVEVSGVTEPGVELSINGKTTPVGRRGKFSASMKLGAVPDSGVIEVVATDRYGLEKKVEKQVVERAGSA